MFRVKHDMRHVYGRFALALSLELLPQLEKPVLNLIFHVRVEFFLTAYELRLRVLLLRRHRSWGELQVHTTHARGLRGGEEEGLTLTVRGPGWRGQIRGP